MTCEGLLKKTTNTDNGLHSKQTLGKSIKSIVKCWN